MAPTVPFLQAQIDAIIDDESLTVNYYIVGLFLQTLFFGFYTIIAFMSTKMLLERRLNTRLNQVMFGITAFMYLLSAAYWFYNIADGMDRLNGFAKLAKHPLLPRPQLTTVTFSSPLWNALTLINYVLSDAVVVWRAWIICLRNQRKYLWITIGFLVLTALTVLLTIVFRIVGLVISPVKDPATNDMLGRAINILQVLTLFTSLFSNLTATGVVGLTAWRHYLNLTMAFSEKKAGSARTSHILMLVVETGSLYCVSAFIVLMSALIKLPHGTLGDIYTPINVQIAGAYPCIVLLLVNRSKSLDDSTFCDQTFVGSGTPTQPIYFKNSSARDAASPRHNASMHFARNPGLTSTFATTEFEDESPSEFGMTFARNAELTAPVNAATAEFDDEPPLDSPPLPAGVSSSEALQDQLPKSTTVSISYSRRLEIRPLPPLPVTSEESWV